MKLKVEYVPTSSLVPYAGNAKRHDVDAICASIESLGFNDPVGVWTNPDGMLEIVEGHGRVMAAKRLGMGKLPIIKLDHLDDDGRRAYVHVHNQTALAEGFDMAALESELSGIPGFDWGDFGFDMPSVDEMPDMGIDLEDVAVAEGRPSERLRTDRAYNLHLVDASDCGSDGMPRIAAVDFAPSRLIGFNYAKTAADKACGVHFFVDDYQFERCWNSPEENLGRLRGFECALTPDFSLYMDMPLPMQQWNVYRSRALGCYWQREGLMVVPTLSWSTSESYAFAFAGLEPHGTYAVSTVGVRASADAMGVWRDGMAAAMRALEPRRILLYGDDIGFGFGDCEVVWYENEVTVRMEHGR